MSSRFHFAYFLSILIFPFIIFADNSIRIDDLDDFSAYASSSSSSSLSMVVSAPASGGLGSTEDDPVLVWIPINSGGDQANNTTVATPSLLPENPTVGAAAYITISLLVTNQSTSDMYVNVAVENDGDYESFKMAISDSSRLISSSTETSLSVIINLADLCDQYSSSEYCSEDTDFQEDLIIYFYLDDEIESNSDVETSTEGLFFELKISDQFPTENMALTALNKGDERLSAELTGGSDISYMGDDFYKIFIYTYSGTTENSSATVGASGAEYFSAYEADETDETGDFFSGGSIAIKDLTNDTQYNFSLTKVNNYQFAAPLSNSMVQAPENIAAFLEKQSCYLLSAGFQQRHYVLDYFREVRDQYLLKTALGSSFVDWYYKFAPHYTSYILESEILSAIIRFLGYLFYFLFKIGPYVFAGMLIIGANRIFKNFRSKRA